MARFTSGPAMAMRISRAGLELRGPVSSIRVTPPMGSRMIDRTATPLRASHQCVTEFMQHHAAENDAHERQAAGGAAGAHRDRLRDPDKCQQKHERQVKANIHPKQTPCGNRPTSHVRECAP